MKSNNLSRRKLLQSASTLLIGATVTPPIFGQSFTSLTDEEPKPIYMPKGSGKKVKISKMEITFKLDKTQTSGHFGSCEIIIQAGQLGAPPHYHKNFDEICIVLEGTVQIMVEDEVFEVTKGGWHLRPRGKVHTFWNSSKKKAKVIELCSPGGHELYLQDLAKLFENGAGPTPNDFGKLSENHDIVYRFDKLEEVIKKYGVSL